MSIDAAKYGPWAVIAGGSEGIGACMAVDLAEVGINSVLVARKIQPLEDVATEVRAAGAEARILALDLTEDDLLDRIREATDDIEVGLLVCNAGASHRTGPFLEWPIEDVVKVIRLNVVAQSVLSHHFARRMAKRGRGGIILMGSLASVAGSPSVITYSGAKAYSQIFSEGLWWELKQQGIDVLHVVVGTTRTPAMERLGIIYPEEDSVAASHVAELSLANIGDGPVFVMPEMEESFQRFVAPDRREVTELNAALTLGHTKGSFVAPDPQSVS